MGGKSEQVPCAVPAILTHTSFILLSLTLEAAVMMEELVYFTYEETEARSCEGPCPRPHGY